MDIITTYPAWFTAFCVLTGATYAFLLYRFGPRTKEFPAWIKRSLAFLRFLLIFIIAFLLLRPLIRTQQTELEEPVIAILQDASSSVPLGGDSTFYADEYPRSLQRLNQELSGLFDLRRFSFGQALSDSIPKGFSGKQTDIARALKEIRERFRDRNLAGVILATDGIYNKGSDPRYLTDRFNAPIHPVALGDTAVRKDLILKEVMHNRYAYQGNRFPVESVIRGRKAKGVNSVLTIEHGGEELYNEELSFDRNSSIDVSRTTLKADSAGLQRYLVRVDPVDGEVSNRNNEKEIFIEVLESKRKVLALAHSPHPDIRALKWAIEQKNSYKVSTELAEEFDGEVGDTDLLVLHQLPSGEHGVHSLLEKAEEQEIPILFVLGAATSYAELDPFIPGLSIQGKSDRTDEAKPVYNKNFGLFDVGGAAEKVSEWPPLSIPFGDWKVGKGLENLLRKKVGQVTTKEPLWAFGKNGGQKVGVITGEGLWRWRLRNMTGTGDTKAFDRMLEKTVQYLSVREDKSRFRVEGDKEYRENEAILFTAELYDRSYDLINEAEVRMTVRNEEGKTYPFAFSKTQSSYRLDAGSLPVGEYSYKAKVGLEGDTLLEEGRFTVTPVRIERSRTVADHGLLYDLARKTGGTVFYPDEMKSIPDSIQSSESVKPLRYTQERLTDLISWKWLFLPLLLLMSLEWTLRKRMGAY